MRRELGKGLSLLTGVVSLSAGFTAALISTPHANRTG
jgi:hypothetical protein